MNAALYGGLTMAPAALDGVDRVAAEARAAALRPAATLRLQITAARVDGADAASPFGNRRHALLTPEKFDVHAIADAAVVAEATRVGAGSLPLARLTGETGANRSAAPSGSAISGSVRVASVETRDDLAQPKLELASLPEVVTPPTQLTDDMAPLIFAAALPERAPNPRTQGRPAGSSLMRLAGVSDPARNRATAVPASFLPLSATPTATLSDSSSAALSSPRATTGGAAAPVRPMGSSVNGATQDSATPDSASQGESGERLEARLVFEAGKGLPQTEAVAEDLMRIARSVLDGHGQVRLVGFAGPAGDLTAATRQASDLRARAVKHRLVRLGVPNARIETAALGGWTGDGPAERVDVFVTR